MAAILAVLAPFAVAGVILALAVYDGVPRRRPPLVVDAIAVTAGYVMWSLYLR